MKLPTLATVFAVRLGLTLASAMAVYAVIAAPDVEGGSAWRLAATHGLHVLALAALVYGVLLFGFERLVCAPLAVVRRHLYGVATGRLEPLELRARVREIDEITRCVNLMVGRMRLGGGDADPHRTALALRDVAARFQPRGPVVALAILEAAAALEAVAARGPDGPDADAVAERAASPHARTGA